MKKRPSSKLLAIAWLTLISYGASAEVFTCTKAGKKVFQSTPCKDADHGSSAVIDSPPPNGGISFYGDPFENLLKAKYHLKNLAREGIKCETAELNTTSSKACIHFWNDTRLTVEPTMDFFANYIATARRDVKANEQELRIMRDINFYFAEIASLLPLANDYVRSHHSKVREVLDLP